MLYNAKCHCGAVQAEVEAPEHIDCYRCNCSMCSLTAYLHLIVPKSKFKLLHGQDSIESYSFNTGVAKHTFCKRCGIKVFYTPRSNPDGYSVNVRCLHPQPRSIGIENFDGNNWEESAHKLAGLSKEN
ncbi:Uncharacterized conserved protein [Alteromonadaceae bacterium Bs31]|nr:Uncharacterized conserved protein [Alteromonadaceae bacterium Bs31]